MTSTAATVAVAPPTRLPLRRAVRIRRAVVAGYLHGLSVRHDSPPERRKISVHPTQGV